MKSSKVVLGVMASFAAGAVLGILYAPKKGRKTRRMIVSKSEEYVDAVKEKINDVLDGITEQCQNFCHETDIIVAKGKIGFESSKDEQENLVN